MRIKSHAPLMYVGMTAAGVITLAFMGIFGYLMRQQGRDRWFLYVVLSPFVLMGAALAFFGGRFLLRLARRGSWQLDVPGSGGELGRPFDVTLFPSRTRVPSGELTCHLRCIRIVKLASQGSSAGRSSTTTLWETTWTIRAGTIHPNIGLPLSLPLPASGEPTNISPQSGAGTQWQLNVVVPTGGANDEAVFDLPVRA
jgi:hypothetical protein